MNEENAIAQGDCSHWLPSDYKLRFEEVDRLTDMLNQLAVSLGRMYICIPGYKVSGFVKMISRAVTDWADLPDDLSVRTS